VLGFLLFGNFNSIAQKKTKFVSNSQKKKIVKARSLLNKSKLYQGEKKFKALLKQNPDNPYFHEALVSIQYQILQIIKETEAELKEMEPDELPDKTDEPEKEDSSAFFLKDTSQVLMQVVVENDNEKVKITKGQELKPTTVSKKERRKLAREKAKQQEKNELFTDAQVEIDSSIIKEEKETIDLVKDFGNDQKEDTSDNATYMGDNFRGDKDLATMSEADKAKYQIKRAKYMKDLLIMPYKEYKNQLLAQCRESTLQFENTDSASKYLHQYLIDTINVDSAITETAQDKYEVALDEVKEGNIKLGIQYLKDALDEQPLYYAANRALADAYLEDNQDSMYLKTLKRIVLLFPYKAEPLEKISTFYTAKGNFDTASAYLINAILIYPEKQYFTKLKDLVKHRGKDYSSQWVEREVYPIDMQNKFEELFADKDSPWRFYQQAKQEVYNYVDTNGIFRGNEITREHYVEVYAWIKMLDSSYKAEFSFAKNMRKMGYLDCYVLVSLFHQDLYTQFYDLVRRKPEKVKDYFYVLLNWDMHKFEKVRKD
jgi:hypothetical protein